MYSLVPNFAGDINGAYVLNSVHVVIIARFLLLANSEGVNHAIISIRKLLVNWLSTISSTVNTAIYSSTAAL